MSAGSRSHLSLPFGRPFHRQFVKFLGLFTGIALGCLAALPAVASPALVQHASKDAGVTVSSSLSFPVNNTAGNWIGVVIRAGHSGQVLAVSDSRGNTYRQALQFNQTLDTPNGETVAIYYAENIAGGANTVTVSESISNNTLRFAILEYSGLATSNSLDVMTATQGTGTTLNTGTATTTVGGDMVLTALATANGATYTAGSGFTIEERVPAAPGTKLMVEDGIQAVAGGVSATATLAAADNWGAGLAAFKAASGVLPPSISNLNPTSGPVGSQVTIAGSNFGTSQGTSTVTFNGVSAGTASNWSASSITAIVPASASTGAVIVTVGGVASNGVAFTVTPPPPIISSLTPNNGPIGTSVTIAGSNFGASQGISNVTFNGVSAGTATSWSATSITVVVPSGATTGPVVVIIGGVASNGVPFVLAPSIASLSPTSAPVGNAVTISGANFGASQGASTVTFNGTAANPTSWSNTSIFVLVPNGATTGNVVVTVGGQASNGVAFTVLPTPNITNISPGGAQVGASVTITGTNFGASQGTSTVTFYVTQATPTSWSPTSITVPVPAGASSGNVVVVVNGVLSNAVPFTVAPKVANLSANSGVPGTAITIGGSNFGSFIAGDTVTFNGTLAQTGIWTDTSINATVPTGAATGPVVVTVGGFPSNNNVNFIITPVTITALNPTSGPAGTSVTITGTNFGPTQGTSNVAFGVLNAAVSSWSQTTIVVSVPAGLTGTNVVTVNEGVVGSNGVNFSIPAPTITSLNPTSGLLGTSMTITGTSFGTGQQTSTLTLNGTPLGVTRWNDTSIAAFIPIGATSGPVVVTTSSGTSNGINFTVIPSPTISSLSPTSGAVGTPVTITGTSFGATQGTSTVIFNGVSATVTSWSDTNISVTVPSGATTGNVGVVRNGVASNPLNFTVIPPPPSITSLNPSSGAVGALILISGANFGSSQGTSTVTFNGTSAGSIAVTGWSSVSITVQVPAGATTGNVVVTVGGVASNGVPFTVTAPPSITSLSPTSGPVGTSVVITGTNFGATQGTSAVIFNGTTAAVSNWSATSITAAVPTGATTGNVVVDVTGVNSNGVAFTVTPPTPSISNLNPTNGPVGTPVTITGTNFGASQGASTVTFTGTAATPTGWNATSIVAPVPSGATSGNVVVTVRGVASNGVNFTVTPSPTITSLNPVLGTVGTTVTIAGANFGASQGTSTVTFNGTSASPTSWGATGITVPVPAGAATGNVVVTIGGQVSNGANFTVQPAAVPIALVQHRSLDAGTTSSATLAFIASNTAGNFIAVAIRAGHSGQIFTVTDSLGNTYHPAIQLNVTLDTPNGDTLGTFFAENIAGGPNAVTVSDSISSTTLRFAVLEYSGIAKSNSLDNSTAAQGTGTAANSGNVPTTVSGDLLFGTILASDPTNFTAGNGYILRDAIPALPNAKLLTEDQSQSAAGSASATASLSTSVKWGAGLAAFKPAAGSGSSSPTITSLSPTSGMAEAGVTVTGTNFGAMQGNSILAFNGAAATATSWSATSITAPVPTGASTGNVVVTVGGVASNGVTFTVISPPPSIASLNPSSAIAGGGSFTLSIVGTNFVPASIVQWNGSARTTAFISSTQLQAAISSIDIGTFGTAKVTVANPGFGGGISPASTFFVGATGGSNFAVISVNQPAQDIVYDPKNQVIYVSVPGTASNNPNTISVLDPTTGTITSALPAGNNPNVLAISDDSQFLYAGIDGAASVQRFVLPGLGQDISYPLGTNPTFGPYFALDLQVAPGAPHTTAVTLGNTGVSPKAQGGIAVFDDAISRPTKAAGGGNVYDSLQWGANASTLFASANDELSGFELYSLSVNGSGVTLSQNFRSPSGTASRRIHFDAATQLVYADEGHVINPATGLPTGGFNASGAMVVDPVLNTAFFASVGTGTITIESFDLNHFTPINSINIPVPFGTPLRLVRWGQNGLAFIDQGFNGSNQVILVGGNFVSPAPAFAVTPPPTPTPLPTPAANAPTISSLNPSSAIAGSGAFTLTVIGTQFDPAATVQFNGSALATTFVSSTQLQATISASNVANPGAASVTVANAIANGGTSAPTTFFVGTTGGTSSAGTGFAVKIVNQASKDIMFDPADQLLYLSVPNTVANGNTIAVLDPATTKIAGEQYAGSNPNVIAISDDSQFLYAGIDGPCYVQRFTLPGLQADIHYSLVTSNSLAPQFALDLQVAPGAPHTTAVTAGVFTSTPAAQGGITIFDDATARPTIAKGFGPGGGGNVLYDSLQWGSDATTLFAANDEGSGFDFYTLSVNSSGVVLANDYPNTFSSFRNRIHFDSGTKLIYADDGHVINPTTGLSAGNFGVAGVMVPDSTLNRGFFVISGAGSTVTIQAFDLTHFTAISSITISNVSGNPLRLIRWGQNGLAFNTDAGQIVLVGGNFVH